MKQKSNKWILLITVLSLMSCAPVTEIDDREDVDSGSQTGNNSNGNGNSNVNQNNNSGNNNTQTEVDTLDVLWDCLWAYYPFDDDANEVVLDKAGWENPYDGALFGGKYIDDTPDGKGKALMLNGNKEQYVNIPYNIFKDLEKFTICFWIKDFETGVVITGINPAYDVSYQQNMHWPKLLMRNDGKISFDAYGELYDYNDNCPKFSSYTYTPIQSSGWHHVAVAFDGSTAHLYVDGLVKDNVSARFRKTSDGITKVNIGGNGNGSLPVYISMKIDNVSVYGAYLGSSYIKYIYRNLL